MKKLLNEFFYIPKHGKIREKVMLTRITMTVAIMVMCLIAMSVSAYAYFSHNISSASNKIKTANFETSISVEITDENGKTVNITPITTDRKNYQTEALEVWRYYTIKIRPTENCTAKTGYVSITANGCKETYHTQQLGLDSSISGGKTESISFELMITDQTKVEFQTNWGTSSYYDDYVTNGDQKETYITQNEKIKMIVNGITTKPSENEPAESETTEQGDTTTDPSENETTESETTEQGNTTTDPSENETTESETTEQSDTTTDPSENEPTESETTEQDDTATEPSSSDSTESETTDQMQDVPEDTSSAEPSLIPSEE